MELRELRARLWYWTARHPEWEPREGGPDRWEPDVGCYAHVTASSELVLLDPLVVDGDWRALDALVEAHGAPHVLITISWHGRSADAVLDRYEGARVWAYDSAADEMRKRTRVTDAFALGEPLPGGIAPYEARFELEVDYWLPDVRGVVTGDSLLRPAGRPVRVWQGGDETRRALRPLLELPIELLLLTHGEPVLEGGRDALERALEG